MATTTENEVSTASKALVLVAVLLLFAGIAGYYYLAEQSALYAVGSVFAGAILGALVFFQSQQGKELWAFGRLSFREMKKVVWPTPNEAFQTTLVVIGFCLAMGFFFWVVDISVISFIKFINGLGS